MRKANWIPFQNFYLWCSVQPNYNQNKKVHFVWISYSFSRNASFDARNISSKVILLNVKIDGDNFYILLQIGGNTIYGSTYTWFISQNGHQGPHFHNSMGWEILFWKKQNERTWRNESVYMASHPTMSGSNNQFLQNCLSGPLAVAHGRWWLSALQRTNYVLLIDWLLDRLICWVFFFTAISSQNA